MYRYAPFAGTLVFLIGFVLYTCVFIVPEGRQAVVRQFGKVVPPSKQAAGWYVKLPWQDVTILEKRILNWDGIPNQIPTKDKKYIIVDTTARWKIEDPVKFIENLVTMDGARSKIKNWIDSATRDIISSHNLVEAVRNTNDILDQQIARKGTPDPTSDDEVALEGLSAIDESSGELLRVAVGREQLSQKIVERAKQEMVDNGLSLIDVQLRRIAYEESVEQKVYNRMKTERERIAAKLKSIGEGEQAKIRGKKERELQQIEAQAYREVQMLKGQAESEAMSIYADAVGDNTEFYEFLRTVELYRDGLRDDTKLILSANSKFMRYLKQGPSAR